MLQVFWEYRIACCRLIFADSIDNLIESLACMVLIAFHYVLVSSLYDGCWVIIHAFSAKVRD